MGEIDYKSIYDKNKEDWKALTENPQKYEALLAGHYSDSNHFVYELLQNAEDENASKVVIEYYSDKLVFYHNGTPFDEDDVKGVSSMLMGTKDREDAQTIGRFGMGFKSVFKYTYQPEIYSDNEAFKITRYLLPEEITEGWDYKSEKDAIVCKLADGHTYMPFKNEEHLTKIIIPFLKYNRESELESVPGEDVLEKLNELDGQILLFLSSIKHLYWTNKETDTFAKITLSQDEKDDKLITCRIEGTKYREKEEISRYLKFKKIFNHSEMKNAEVSVAYRLNSRADNINEVQESPVWVYFPTRDDTDLPFLIHGSFETAVSREKLMAPSKFNSDLFGELRDLIADSLPELASRKLITQAFLRRIVIATFKDEDDNETIPGIKDAITRAIKKNGLLPDRDGNYFKPKDLFVPVPFKIADFANTELFAKVFDNKKFVAFNNEREANFGEYYNWLVDDLEVPLYELSRFATDLKILQDVSVPSSGQRFEDLKNLYDFLSDNRESVYDTGYSYSRSGPYESTIRYDIADAWAKLRRAPIILNRTNLLIAAEVDNKPAIYMGSSSAYKNVMQYCLVNTSIASSFGRLLSEGFLIKEFDNFQYIKEKIIKKYVDIGDEVGFVNQEDFTSEYIEDLNQIIDLIQTNGDIFDIQELLEDAYIIKVKPKDDDEGATFSIPGSCYVPISDEGIDLEIYYHDVLIDSAQDDNPYWHPNKGYDSDEEEWVDFDVNPIDKEFYEKNGISISTLAKFGLITSPVIEGARSQEGVGDSHWVAMGEYCPNIIINGLHSNLRFIEFNSDEDIAKQKSAEILKLLLKIYPKLVGQKRLRKNNPYLSEIREVGILQFLIKDYEWLYDSSLDVHKPSEMSCYDLNRTLYGAVDSNKEAYTVLGFVKKDVDSAEETLQKAHELNLQDKKRLLESLARDLGLQVSEKESDDWDDEAGFFNPNSYEDDDFPVHRINNIEYLLRHVREQFYCADPTTYRKVWRQIRVSKNAKADRSYAIGMYTNSSNTKICQMCKKPVVYIEVDQIANFGIEMPQLNLCLCRECSAKYRTLRDGNKKEFKSQIREAILSLDVDDYSDEYSIEFNEETALHFTQTHIAEIQEIIRLLAEYGTPAEDVDEVYNDEPVVGPLMSGNIKREMVNEPVEESEEVFNPTGARAGQYISYKKRFANDEIYDTILQPDKYPLHAAFIGHNVGDVIVFQTKEYEIIGL